MSTNETENVSKAQTEAEIPRRGFLYKTIAAGIGTLVGLVPAIAGLLPLLDPIKRRRNPETDAGTGPAWFPVAGIDALPTNGSPQKFPVFADKVDAWNTIPNTRVGAVYLKRDEAGNVQAWNVVCPHAGCFVAAQTDGSFVCPCHDSEFNDDGTVREVNKQGNETKSPRDMDSLEAKVEDGRVLVQFFNYQAAVPEKNQINQPIRPPKQST
jgi:Rieske Fe-S protein